MGATTQKVIVEWLSALPLFKSSTKKDLRIVARHLEIVEVSNGTEVAVEGTPGDGFFILLSGTATVTRGNKLVAKLSEGDFFGELALIDPGPRTAAVAVTSDAVLGAPC
jgi:CRP/FNR family transcriptional regulator, cyclic AMP receptor protein